MSTNAKSTHKAVLLIRIEMLEVSENGEPLKHISPQEFSANGINTKSTYTITGFDKFECFKKLKQVLNGIK